MATFRLCEDCCTKHGFSFGHPLTYQNEYCKECMSRRSKRFRAGNPEPLGWTDTEFKVWAAVAIAAICIGSLCFGLHKGYHTAYQEMRATMDRIESESP